MSFELLSGYKYRIGSGRDRALLLKFLGLTYQELFPDRADFSHLSHTVEGYLSQDTPMWWVEKEQEIVAVLWMGNAIAQDSGDRHAHIFLLYVKPEHRRLGIAKALMQLGEDWARKRGDRQIGLQVFQNNQPALDLYQHLGYQTQSLWMVKPLSD